MVRVFERWGRVRAMERPDGYAFRIAVNCIRRRRRAPTVPLEAVEAVGADDMGRIDARTQVLSALRHMPQDQREAIVLTLWFGLSSEEAAAVLGIRPASVRGRIHRARQALRDGLGVDDE